MTGIAKLATFGAAVALAGSAAVCAQAQEATRPIMTAEGARAIVDGCMAYATANDMAFAIAVYDEGSNLLAYARMDGLSPGIGDVAQWKGTAAARSGFATSFQGELIARGGAAVAMAPGFAGVQGGVPVLSADGRLMGGAGASGAAPAQDEACVRAGIEAAGYSAPPAAAE